MHSFTQVANNLAIHWSTILTFLQIVFVSTGLSALFVGPQKAIKKWFEHNEVIIIGLIGVTSTALMFVWNYLVHSYPTNPHLTAVQGFALAFSTQPVYFIIVKPLSQKIGVWFAERVKKAESIQSAAIPPEGLPLATPPPETFNQ